MIVGWCALTHGTSVRNAKPGIAEYPRISGRLEVTLKTRALYSLGIGICVSGNIGGGSVPAKHTLNILCRISQSRLKSQLRQLALRRDRLGVRCFRQYI